MSSCPTAVLNTATIGIVPDHSQTMWNAFGVSEVPTLKQLCIANRWRLALTYSLFNIENCAQLVQPWLLGLTITSILGKRTGMVWVFAGFFTMRMVVGVLRRRYDTRAFARIYGTLATNVVVNQRRNNVAVSRVAARASMSREVTDFLETDVPAAVSTIYAIAGGILMLGFYDILLVPVTLVIGVSSGLLNVACAKRTRLLNQGLNDVLENEVQVVSHGSRESTSQHYDRLAYWQVRVSDWHATTFSATQVFVLGLLVFALLRIPAWSTDSIGDIYAVFRYLTMFTGGIGGLPMISQRIARLRDIHHRFSVTTSVELGTGTSGIGGDLA
jgi:uncharacterized membrane protein